MRESEFRIIWEWFKACLDWWYALVPGVVLAIIDIIERKRDKPIPISSKCIVGIFAAGLFISQFLAYRDLRKQVINSKPYFKIEIDQSLNSYDAEDNTTSAFLAVGITNTGAPSSVTGYKAHFSSSSLDADVQVQHPVGRVVFPLGRNMEVELKEEGYIFNKTIPSIQTGSSVVGRLPILIPGDHVAELTDGRATIVVSICDFLGNPFYGTFKAIGAGTIPMALPGEIPVPIASLPSDIRISRVDISVDFSGRRASVMVHSINEGGSTLTLEDYGSIFVPLSFRNVNEVNRGQLEDVLWKECIRSALSARARQGQGIIRQNVPPRIPIKTTVPEVPITLTGKMVKSLRNSQNPGYIYAMGLMQYKDAMGIHETQFCAFRKDSESSVGLCRAHNGSSAASF